MQKSILVLGVGNVLLKDDGLGPLVIEELQNSYQSPHVTFLDGGTLGLDLLAYLEDCNRLVIVDALDFGKKPGTIICWQDKNFCDLFNQVSFHQVSLKELFSAIQLLGMDLEIIVLGIQIEDISWGIGLSESVKNAVPLLKRAILEQLD